MPNNPDFLQNVIGYASEVFPIPAVSLPGTGALSYQSGWPAITSVPLESGGIAPQREYFNAINKLFSAHLFFLQSGCLYPWSPLLDYHILSQIKGPDGQGYIALKASGPSSGGAKNPVGDVTGTWQTIKDFYMTKATGIVQNGGGLGIDANGQIYVDFSQMPTDKFEALLRSIRVPIWLTNHTNFYVDKSHPAATDDLEQRPGLSMDKPFKNIDPCLSYVINNYNMVNFQALIRIAAGAYAENLNLGQFSKTSGSVALMPYPGHEGLVNINMAGTNGMNCAGGPYNVIGLNLNFRPVYTSPDFWGFPSLCSIQASGEINFRACAFDYTDLSGLAPGAKVDLRLLAGYGGIYRLYPSLEGERNMSFKYQKFEDRDMSVLFGELGTTIGGGATNLGASYAKIFCEGAATNFLRISDSTFTNIGGAEYLLQFDVPAGKTATGRRFIIANGGRAMTGSGGNGDTFFPGNEAGYVESSTYSFIK